MIRYFIYLNFTEYPRIQSERNQPFFHSFSKFKFPNLGSGGGTSGRAMAFCLGRLGSNPGSQFGFLQSRIAVNLFSLGVGLFLITCIGTVHTPLPSSFLFPIIIYRCKIINFKLKMFQLNPKNLPGNANIF